MKAFAAFLIGLALMLLFYYFVSIPILPCVSIYAAALLFAGSDRFMRLRMGLIITLTLISVWIYTNNAIYMIRFYPQGGNVLAVIFEFLTIFAFVGSGVLMSVSTYKEYNGKRLNKAD